HAADRQSDLPFECRAARALGEAAGERDLRMVLDVEEVGAAQMLIALRLACPDPGSVYLALERRIEAALPVELEPSVDVLEDAAHPRDHHVPGAKLGLRVPRLEDPSCHSSTPFG